MGSPLDLSSPISLRVTSKTSFKSMVSYPQYWKSKTEEMNRNSREFYKVFKPFLDSKTRDDDDSKIILENCGSDIKDQTMVADCFTGIAQGIGDSELLTLTEEQLHDTKSIQDKRNSMRIVNGPKFSFSKVS